MCVRCATADQLALVSDARDVADALLGRYLRLGVAKAMNLGMPAGFDRAVARLARLLQSRSSDSDHAAVKAAVEVLDVDWHRTTAEQRRNLIARALEASGRKTAAVPTKVQAVFGDAATEVVRATRDGARRDQKLAIGADFNAVDQRVIRHLRSSQANYIRDEYGRRHEAFSERARLIVADGLEAGLGRDDVARDLESAARDIIAGRGSFYWETVAGAFVSSGRSFGQLSAYAEAGIDRYIIEAVLDERTTEICRFLDGKTFTVATGLRAFERVEAEPDLVQALTPWVREAIDPETGRKVLFVEGRDGRTPLAQVTRSAAGTRDDRGDFSRALSERDLENLGISFPPYHGLCRSTTVAAV